MSFFLERSPDVVYEGTTAAQATPSAELELFSLNQSSQGQSTSTESRASIDSQILQDILREVTRLEEAAKTNEEPVDDQAEEADPNVKENDIAGAEGGAEERPEEPSGSTTTSEDSEGPVEQKMAGNVSFDISKCSITELESFGQPSNLNNAFFGWTILEEMEALYLKEPPRLNAIRTSGTGFGLSYI